MKLHPFQSYCFRYQPAPLQRGALHGADAVVPYLTLEALVKMRRDGIVKSGDVDSLVANYTKAASKGMLKVSPLPHHHPEATYHEPS